MQYKIDFKSLLPVVLVLLSLSLNNCAKKEPSCVYTELASENTQIQTINGHKFNVELEAKILANLKALSKLEGKFRVSDSIYYNLATEVKNKTVNYSEEFIATHNALIQILCDIDQQLRDEQLNGQEHGQLFREKMDRRTEYFNFLLSKSTPVQPNDENNIQDTNRALDRKSNPKKELKSSSSSYFDQHNSTQIAILAYEDMKILSDLSGILSHNLTEQGFETSSSFFRASFLQKFGTRLDDYDLETLYALNIQKQVNCVCLVQQEKLELKPNTYEENNFITASGRFKVSLLFLNPSSSTQTFQFSTQGAGTNEAMAMESLYENFINLFHQKAINLALCKK